MLDIVLLTLKSSFIGFVSAFLVCGLIIVLLRSLIFLQRTYKRKETSREAITPLFFRLGGIGLIVSFWIVFFLDGRIVFSPGFLALLTGSIAILLFGLLDDFFPLSWKAQLFFQCALGVILIYWGLSIDLMQSPWGGTIDFRTWAPFFPFLILFLWLVVIMNALNWLDGLDGLLGSVSLIGFLTLFIVSLLPEVNQPALSLVTLMLAGGVLAFLIFNWYPAKILAGTGGAYFLGFSLVTLSVMAGAKVATTLLVLTIPVIDAFFVIWERYRSGQSIFHPDQRHLHYRLLELGWSVKGITLLYTALTLFMAFLALFARTLEKLVIFGCASLLLLVVCFAVGMMLQKKKSKTL